MNVLLLSAAALLFAVGGLAMKYSQGMTRPLPSLLFLLLFGAGASCQAIAMRSAAMGTVYIFVLGLEAIAALALSVALLDERLSLSRAAAVVLIVAGMVLLKQ